jgi:hypothetical protein
MDLLGLHPRKLKPLAYAEVVRKDLKLLEVDDELLGEIEKGRCGQIIWIATKNAFSNSNSSMNGILTHT